MGLLMTRGMKQNAVLCRVWSTFGSPEDVMALPASDRGDLLVTDRAEAVLLLPEVK